VTINKRSPVFKEKIGVTPSVAAPGDTNAGDATGFNVRRLHTECYEPKIHQEYLVHDTPFLLPQA